MVGIGETLQNFVNADIHLYNAEGPLWLILLTSILLYVVFYLLTVRVPPFSDAEDDKMAKIFAIVLALIVTTTSPATVGIMWAYINMGGWTIMIMTFALFI